MSKDLLVLADEYAAATATFARALALKDEADSMSPIAREAGDKRAVLAEALAALDTAQSVQVNAMLVEALEQAHDMVDHWGCYASDYFQQKHDLAGDKAKIKDAITTAKQAQPERAEDSVNAKRYLWLRDEAYSAGGKTPFIVIGRDDSDCYVVSSTTADEAIDAAIKQGGQHD